MAETVHTPVELHLFSDMQKTEMPGNFADMVLPGNVTVVLHTVGEKAAVPNWTVESVQCSGADWRIRRTEEVAGAGGDCGV